MSVLKSDDGKELMVICKCGCDGLHIKLETDYVDDNDPERNLYCYATYMNSNWYRDQDKKIQYVILDKLKKIWAIIQSKDFYYSEICMMRKDFETFREYINEVK